MNLKKCVVLTQVSREEDDWEILLQLGHTILEARGHLKEATKFWLLSTNRNLKGRARDTVACCQKASNSNHSSARVKVSPC